MCLPWWSMAHPVSCFLAPWWYLFYRLNREDTKAEQTAAEAGSAAGDARGHYPGPHRVVVRETDFFDAAGARRQPADEDPVQLQPQVFGGRPDRFQGGLKTAISEFTFDGSSLPGAEEQ